MIAQPSRLVDISEFVVLCAGALALAFIGLRPLMMRRAPARPPAPEDPAQV